MTTPQENALNTCALRGLLFAIAILIAPVAAMAQAPPRVPVVGVLSVGPATSPLTVKSQQAFEQGLRELGWIPGGGAWEPRLSAPSEGTTRAGGGPCPEASTSCRVLALHLPASGGLHVLQRRRVRRPAAVGVLRGSPSAWCATRRSAVEEPSRLTLVVNVKTAQAIGINLPPSILGRADEVFQ